MMISKHAKKIKDACIFMSFANFVHIETKSNGGGVDDEMTKSYHANGFIGLARSPY